MHPRLNELLDHTDRHHRELLAEVERVPLSLRAVRPAPDRWSVTEVLDHLAISASRIARLVDHRVAAGRVEGVGPDPLDSPVAATIDAGRIIDRTDRFVAPPSVAPRDRPDSASAEAELAAAHGRLRAAVHASDGIDLTQLTAPHPLLGELNLYQWLAFVGAHESRHARQVAEIGEALRARDGSR